MDAFELSANIELKNEGNVKFVTYKRRYISLAILLLSTALVFFQFFLYVAIGHVIIEFYGVTYETVNSTALLPDILMLLLFYPIGKFMDKYGFRVTMLASMFINLFANGVKCFTIHRSMFWLLVAAQTAVGLTTFTLMSLSPVFAADWFKTNEIANVIGYSNAISTVGIIISFLPPSTIFNNSSSIDEIQFGLEFITFSTAFVSLLTFILTWTLIEDKPKTPPSLAQQTRTNNEPFSKLIKNMNALLIMGEYCLNSTIIVAIGITLNQSLLSSFEKNATVLTFSGVLLNASGIVGSLFTGLLIQRFQKYNLINIIHGLLYLIFTCLYVISLRYSSSALLYISIFAIGYLSSALFVILMDFLVEVTYPFSEGMLFSFANTVCVLPTFAFVPLVTALTTHYNPIIANKTFIGVGVVYVICSLFNREDLRRKRANEKQLVISESNILTANL